MAARILLVDDSITIQKVVELTFSDPEWQVTSVGDGERALACIREARPDLVLLDVILPGENGYEICDRIKKDPALATLPVLLLTGTFEPFDRRRAESVGADGHLTKPFESQVLVGKVQDMLQRSRRGAARAVGSGQEVVAGPPAAPAPTGLPPQVLEQIARQVAERIGEQVVRDIAWEVVPEVAERLVRQRIREIEEEGA